MKEVNFSHIDDIVTRLARRVITENREVLTAVYDVPKGGTVYNYTHFLDFKYEELLEVGLVLTYKKGHDSLFIAIHNLGEANLFGDD
jgi:hypothetical protein